MLSKLALLVVPTLLLLVDATVYNVKINFNDTALEDIYATQQLVVVVGPGSGNGWHSILSTFTPSEFNYLSWNDTGLSALVTPTPLENGGVVYSYSYISAEPGFSYACQDGSFLDGQSNSWVGKHQIGVINNSTDTLTFGIGQEIYTNSMLSTGFTMMEALLPVEHFAFTLQSSFLIFLAPRSLVQTGGFFFFFDNILHIAESEITTVTFTSGPNIVMDFDESTGLFECPTCRGN